MTTPITPPASPLASGNGGKPRILVVDDEPLNIKVLVELLTPSYALGVAKNGQQALERLTAGPLPDLILLDVMMPGMDGYRVCEILKATPEYEGIPVVFVTAMGEIEDEAKGFALGAVDYLTKPISPAVALARVRTHLRLRETQRILHDYNQVLEQQIKDRTDEVIARTREVVQTQDITIRALASLAETRDNETGNHIRRTQHYIKILAEALVTHHRFSPHLTPGTIELLFKSAPLHDIGKVGIPDSILLKPGKLTPEEFEIMKTHTDVGRNALLAAAAGCCQDRMEFLSLACDIVASHHEKWDGSGYPRGIKGEEIPFSARLMAVADVYDALICKRVYKAAFSHEAAMNVIREGSGRHFDPAVVEALNACETSIKDIAARFAEGRHDGG